jgi:hypothetical protein
MNGASQLKPDQGSKAGNIHIVAIGFSHAKSIKKSKIRNQKSKFFPLPLPPEFSGLKFE